MADLAALAAIPSAQNALAEQQAKLRIQQLQAQQLQLQNAAQQQSVDQQNRLTKGASALGGPGNLAAAFGTPIPGGPPMPQAAASPQQGGMPSMVGAPQGGGGAGVGPAAPPPSTPGMGLKPDNPAASMPPAVALVYQDTAETIGPGVAQHILQESQGDVAKMLQMRQAHYENVARGNPDIAQQLPALTAKNQALAQRVAQMDGQQTQATPPQVTGQDAGSAAADPQMPMRLLMQTIDFVKKQYAQNNPGDQLDGETALELASKIASTSKLFTPEQRVMVQQATEQVKAASAQGVADTRAAAQRDVAGTNAGARTSAAQIGADSRRDVASTNAGARISAAQIGAQAKTAAASIASGGRVTSAQIAAAAKDKATEFGGEVNMWRAKIAAAVNDRRTKANGLKDPGAASPDPAKPTMPGSGGTPQLPKIPPGAPTASGPGGKKMFYDGKTWVEGQ